MQVHTVLPGFVETEGFPQRAVLSSRFFRRMVIAPEDVAARILRVVEKGTRETFIPRWYRIFAIAQALAPGLVARLVARSGYRRPPRVVPAFTGSDPVRGSRGRVGRATSGRCRSRP